ncbi:MAG: collagen binding domain-containing protein [Terriglobia bacterium]
MRLQLVRWLTMVFLMYGVAVAQTKKDGTASIAGVVRGTEGVSVVLHLQPVNDNPARYYDGYEVTAEKDGRFYFAEIKPGTYRLTAEASGFMCATPVRGADAPITLHANEKRKGVMIALIPRRVLCGRVTENGIPRKTWMNAFLYKPEFGTLSQPLVSSVPSTGADGSYRITDLAPGTYYLQGYTTWYPGSFSFNGAKQVIVDAGRTECSFDIPLQYAGCYVTKVNGRIATSLANDNGQYQVNFLERNAAGGNMPTTVGSNLNSVYKAGDNFSASVCPGDYDVVLSDQERIDSWREFPSHKVVFDNQHITIGPTEIDGVVLTPHPMASIAGEIHFEGMTTYASCPGLGGQQIRILREGDGQFQSVVLSNKNRFEFQNVAPGNYRLFLGPYLREAIYVKSILVDGEAADGRRFSIKQAKPVSMEVTLSGDIAQADGHVSADLRSEPRWEVAWTRPKGAVAGKVLGDTKHGFTLKLRSARYNSNASAEYTERAASDGSFHFDSVDPGVYTLRAESGASVEYEYGAHEAGERGAPIIVARGARVEGLTLAPPKLSTICGRVTDANGVPQTDTRIFVETFYGNYLRGSKGIPELLTDADGRFRAEGLLPGEYFPALPYGGPLVYFSNDGSLSAATPVRLHAGENIGCDGEAPLELRVPTGINKLYTIWGYVVGELPARMGDRFWVSVAWDVNTPGTQPYVASGQLDDEHRFRINAVPNGRFLLQLHSAYGPEPHIWSGPYGPVSHLLATQTIEVQGEDVRDVKIMPMDLPTVTGTVHFTNLPADWKKFDVSAQRITLVPRIYAAPFSSKLSADGGFSIGPEDVGDFEVYLNLRHPLYIRSVRLNGHEIRGRYFHLAPAASGHLEVEVSADSGQLDATVTPDPSLPVAEPPVRETCQTQAWPEHQLILFPDPLFSPDADADASVEPRVLVGYRWGDDDSKLRILAVPPGHYRALAAERLSPRLVLGRPNDLSDDERRLWSALAALGQPVTVQADAKVEIALPDKTIDVLRLAARFAVPPDTSLLNTRLAPSF